MYITTHAKQAAKRRIAWWSESRLHDEALTAMIYGKRKDNAFVYGGVVFCFNPELTTLKTVYVKGE